MARDGPRLPRAEKDRGRGFPDVRTQASDLRPRRWPARPPPGRTTVRFSRPIEGGSPIGMNRRAIDRTSASLLERLRDPSDERAWGRFVELYTPLLFSWARKLGMQDADGADLVQDVLVQLLRTLPTFRYDRHQRFPRLAVDHSPQSLGDPETPEGNATGVVRFGSRLRRRGRGGGGGRLSGLPGRPGPAADAGGVSADHLAGVLAVRGVRSAGRGGCGGAGAHGGRGVRRPVARLRRLRQDLGGLLE